MAPDASFRFGPFRLHPVQGLMRGEEEIRVTPRSLDLLNCLAARMGEIITKDELFRSVWRDRVVTDAALTSCIRELRHALGDDARHPRYIETLHRRGYRLIAAPALQPASERNVTMRGNPGAPAHAPWLEKLQRIADRARRASSIEAVMVTGPAGSGKTALVQTFLATLNQSPDPWRICKATCNDNAEPGDAYRPVLELVTQIIDEPGDARTVAVLRESAPSWLAELPARLAAREARMLRQQTSGATRMRRNGELLKALAALATSTPLVLIIEDVQHCDAATADCLLQLARAGDDAAVVMITTCRREELPARSPFRDLGDLFTWTLLELASPEYAPSTSTTHQLEALSDDERRVLESASVAGKSFSTAEAAAGADISAEDADALLMRLSHRGQVIRAGPIVNWPDGMSTSTFEFDHELVRGTVLDTVPIPRRAVMHRRIGRRLEAACKNATGDIAAQLAAHFERSGDYDRALTHHYDAGVVARRRSAPEVASKHFRRALTLVRSLPASQYRDLWEGELLVAIGRELVITDGLMSEAANDAYRRAMELQQRIDDDPALSTTLWGLWVHFLNRGPLENARRVADRLLELAQIDGDPDRLLQAHHALWGTSLMLGDVNAVVEHARQGLALCAAEADAPLKMTMGCTLHDVHLSDHAAAVCAGFFNAWADALGGRKDTAVRSLNAAISHARDIDHPFTLAVTLVLSAGAMAAADDPGSTRRFAEEGRSIAEFQGFGLLLAWALVYEGWALARLGDVEKGLDELLGGLEIGRGVGMTLFRPFQLALAADVQLDSGRFDDATRSLEEAFLIAERVGDRLALSELYRIRGELRLRTVPGAASRHRAASDLGVARDIATEQGARTLAARAIASLQRVQNRRPC